MIQKLYKISAMVSVMLSLYGMERPEYHYADESAKKDIRKIAILAYGSIVNDTRDLKIVDTFVKTKLKVPVSFSRESSTGKPNRRISAVIDNKSKEQKNVWYAISAYGWLPNARNNLAEREGAPVNEVTGQHDLTNMFYIKKLLPDQQVEQNEAPIQGTQGWVVRKLATQNNKRQEMSEDTLRALAKWAKKLEFTAVIWTSFPPNKSRKKIVKALVQDPILLHNTQLYVKNLPMGPQSPFEHAIVNGISALASPLALTLPG
jgi:hypothetical protein